jgi:hypothetical protein
MAGFRIVEEEVSPDALDLAPQGVKGIYDAGPAGGRAF